MCMIRYTQEPFYRDCLSMYKMGFVNVALTNFVVEDLNLLQVSHYI